MRWLFVDFDGTLVESLGVARSVYDRFIRQCGRQPNDDEFRSLNGPSLPEIVARIAERHGLTESPDALLAGYSALWTVAYGEVEPKAGASELLHEAPRRGLHVAVVSSASARFLDRYLDRQGWRGLVNAVVSGDDVARSKPDPAIYLLALERTGALPDQVMAVEDSVNGVTAAAAAGLTVVGLADGGEYAAAPAHLIQAGATRVIGALTELFAGDLG